MVKATRERAKYFRKAPEQAGIEDTTLELEKLIRELRAAYFRATELKEYSARDERMRAEFTKATDKVEKVKEEIDNTIKKLEWLISEL